MIIPIFYTGPYPYESGEEYRKRKKKENEYFKELLGSVTLTENKVNEALRKMHLKRKDTQ